MEERERTWTLRIGRLEEERERESAGGFSDQVSRSAVEVWGFLTGVPRCSIFVCFFSLSLLLCFFWVTKIPTPKMWKQNHRRDRREKERKEFVYVIMFLCKCEMWMCYISQSHNTLEIPKKEIAIWFDLLHAKNNLIWERRKKKLLGVVSVFSGVCEKMHLLSLTLCFFTLLLQLQEREKENWTKLKNHKNSLSSTSSSQKKGWREKKKSREVKRPNYPSLPFKFLLFQWCVLASSSIRML